MTIPSTSWDETSPAGGDNISSGDDAIRLLKTQIREVVDVDHKFDSSGQDAAMGRHTQVSLLVSSGDPTATTAQMFIYQKEVSAVNELFILDDVGNVIQVTDGGVLNCVNLTGTQTVAGEKTFSDDIVLTLDAAVGNDLSVGNDAAITNDLSVGGNLAVTGTTTLTGVLTLVAALDAGGQKLTNLASGVADSDAATVAQLPATTRMNVGAYMGIGPTEKSITDVGFEPSCVIIYRAAGVKVPVMKTDYDTGVKSKKFNGEYVDDCILSLDADGFTVGSDDNVNGSGDTYNWIAWSLN